MPTVIKEPAKLSPGIAVITSNELLNGIVGRGRKALARIKELRDQDRWIFGLHVNGSLHGENSEIPEFISFVLCGDARANFIREIRQPVLEWSAEYFVPNYPHLKNYGKKDWDLLIVSRIAEAKRFYLSVDILEELFKLNSSLRVNIVATYQSSIPDERAYVRKIDERLRNLLRYEVSINAIDSSLFGTFPLTSRQTMTMLAESRGLLITSAFEGGPRVLTEAAALKVPIYVCEDLKSNLENHFDDLCVKRISASPKAAAVQLYDHLNADVEVVDLRGRFFWDNKPDRFREDLERLISDLGYKIAGDWHLEDLHIRLPGHSRIGNLQILYDESLFLDWCNWIDSKGGPVAARCLSEEHKRLAQSGSSYFRSRITRSAHVVVDIIKLKIKRSVGDRVWEKMKKLRNILFSV